MLGPASASAEGAAIPPAAWAATTSPSPGPPRIIGQTGLGCIGGAVALPTDGPGWQAVRLSRNRVWGHPALIAWLREFAGQASRQGFPPVLVGDLGQPRGGPLAYGHSSHQVGLDADIWLDVAPRPMLPVAARETIDTPSLVLPDGSGIDPARWTPRHAALIRLAAEQPGIDRIFVNPAIKRALCRSDAGAAWLHRVRPWFGHDEHMHVRLRCPAGQAECRDQAPPPPGDGCDASLDWWLTPEARHPAPRPPGPPARLPAACRAVLGAG